MFEHEYYTIASCNEEQLITIILDGIKFTLPWQFIGARFAAKQIDLMSMRDKVKIFKITTIVEEVEPQP